MQLMGDGDIIWRSYLNKGVKIMTKICNHIVREGAIAKRMGTEYPYTYLRVTQWSMILIEQ